MARKHLLDGLQGLKLPAGNFDESGSRSPSPAPSSRGAIGAVSRSIEQLRMHSVVELDPALVDTSTVTDRLDEDPDHFAAFAEQIRTNGQQVPILVRPHPEVQGRYQIAYGRRRLRAVKSAGRQIRAIVRPLSDEELVLAQGQENSARADLSFIERALYATELESHGYSRDVIMAALAIDKTGLSRLISTAEQIPRDLIRSVGPAPKAGRDRWTELASRLERDGAVAVARSTIASGGFSELSSDERFVRLFSSVMAKKKPATRARIWKAQDGTRAARIKEDDHSLTLEIDKKAAPEFGDYLIRALPEIYAAYEKARGSQDR
jgi:ParB family chromosome partitioning protein